MRIVIQVRRFSIDDFSAFAGDCVPCTRRKHMKMTSLESPERALLIDKKKQLYW